MKKVCILSVMNVQYVPVTECPAGCMAEGDIYEIDADQCIDCGTCAEICPVGAPKAE